jgi:hypothetical protein
VKQLLNLVLWLKSYEGLKFQGLFCKFPEKNRKIGFSGIIFRRKIHGLGPRSCGPRRPSPSWIGDHCHVPELIRARPPAALVAGVVGRGAEEGEGSTGVPVPGSPGLRRWRSGGASVVKAVAGRASVQVARGFKMGQGGAGGAGEEGMPGRPFIGSKGERGGRASEGNGQWWWCTIMVVEVAVSGGDQPGWWWRVMRGWCSGRRRAHT